MTPPAAALALVAAVVALAAGVGPAGGQAPSRGSRGERLLDSAKPITVDADRMERFGKEGLVVFTGNVVARQDGAVQYADRLEVHLAGDGTRILKTVSTGSVRIVTRDCKTATARRAEYDDAEQRVVLTGDARVWQDEDMVTGETITLFLGQDRSVVQAGPQGRVSAVFHPRGPDRDAAGRPRAACAN